MSSIFLNLFFFLVSCLFFLLITSRPLWCILLIGAGLILTVFIYLVIKIWPEVGRWTKFPLSKGNRCYPNNCTVTYWVKYCSNSWNQSHLHLSESAGLLKQIWNINNFDFICANSLLFLLSVVWYDDYDPSTAPPPLWYRWSILISLWR